MFLDRFAAIALSLAMGIAPLSACAQAQPKSDYTPQVGQAGKDVIWVPTPDALVERMLTMAKVTPNDYVIDLGSGDGRTVIMAVKKFGATALGIEYNPDMVTLSQRNAEREGVSTKARFTKADIFESDFSRAQVITMYLLPDLNLRLRPKLLDMKPGTRLVSHAFTMGDWEPDERAEVESRSAMLWIVPAKVNGVWALKGPNGNYDVDIKQTYQKLAGTVRRGGSAVNIEEGRMNGENISFAFNDGGKRVRFVGKVAGDTLTGALDGGAVAQMNWTGTRRR
jgi:hypothetical protein